MHAAAMEELEPASRLIETRTPATLVKDAVAALSEDLDLAARPDPQLDVTGYEGFVRIAFRLAFWELLHAPDFRAGVIDVANRGGDTDTNAAIAGALLGALHGEAGVPKIWRRCVESACHSPPWEGHPFAGPFHPDRLFDILGSDA
jgi:ADP-ribosylglycohydrolase